MEEQFFQKALSKFAVEFAAGNAIRALADKGLTAEEIHEKLSYPVPRKTIGEMIWAHYLDTCVICLDNPGMAGEKVITSYERVQDAYGKTSFRQIKTTIPITGEYVPCDFGKQLYQNREKFMEQLQGLDLKDRDYVLGLPWPLQTVYHKKDARMERILHKLMRVVTRGSEQTMELWDLYDREGKPTGETFERTHGSYLKIPEGRYHMVCDILVKHVDGTFLLTKRHMSKDVYPGYWEASAGGSAMVGENPITCAKRELFEETGIAAEEFQLISHTFRDKSHSMFYSYLVVTDCPKDSIVLQEGETTEYKWVDVAGLMEYLDSELAIKTHNARYESYFEKLRQETNG